MTLKSALRLGPISKSKSRQYREQFDCQYLSAVVVVVVVVALFVLCVLLVQSIKTSPCFQLPHLGVCIVMEVPKMDGLYWKIS